jgi:hypothetical protein
MIRGPGFPSMPTHHNSWCQHTMLFVKACLVTACVSHPVSAQAALRDAEVEAALHQQHQQQGGSRSPGKLTRSSQSLVRGSQRASKGSFRARISQDVLGEWYLEGNVTCVSCTPSVVACCL